MGVLQHPHPQVPEARHVFIVAVTPSVIIKGGLKKLIPINDYFRAFLMLQWAAIDHSFKDIK